MNDASTPASGREIRSGADWDDDRRRLRRRPLRDLRRDRQDHHLPARGAQRLPAPDPLRAAGRLRAGPQRPRDRRDRAHRRGTRRVLFRRRPAHPGRRRLRRRRRHRPSQRARPPDPHPAGAEAGRRHGGRLRDRRRSRAARRVRPHHRRRQRALRSDRSARRLVRRRVRVRPAGAVGRPEEGARDLVPVPAVRRAGGLRHGAREHRCPARGARGGDGRVVPHDARAQPARAAHDQGVVQRGGRRARRHPAARGRRHAALLHGRGGAGGQARVPREAQARLRPVPESGRIMRMRS